jgi:hypothetical protein
MFLLGFAIFFLLVFLFGNKPKDWWDKWFS